VRKFIAIVAISLGAGFLSACDDHPQPANGPIEAVFMRATPQE
jgi:hypothetical protein